VPAAPSLTPSLLFAGDPSSCLARAVSSTVDAANSHIFLRAAQITSPPQVLLELSVSLLWRKERNKKKKKKKEGGGGRADEEEKSRSGQGASLKKKKKKKKMKYTGKKTKHGAGEEKN
jgi:hypothetical protein